MENQNQSKTFKERLYDWEDNLLLTHPERFNKWRKFKRIYLKHILPALIVLGLFAILLILGIGEIYFYRLIGKTDYQTGTFIIPTAIYIWLFVTVLKELILRPDEGSWIRNMQERQEYNEDNRTFGKSVLILITLIYIALMLLHIFAEKAYKFFLPLWEDLNFFLGYIVVMLILFGGIGVLILIWKLICKIILR